MLVHGSSLISMEITGLNLTQKTEGIYFYSWTCPKITQALVQIALKWVNPSLEYLETFLLFVINIPISRTFWLLLPNINPSCPETPPNMFLRYQTHLYLTPVVVDKVQLVIWGDHVGFRYKKDSEKILNLNSIISGGTGGNSSLI